MVAGSRWRGLWRGLATPVQRWWDAVGVTVQQAQEGDLSRLLLEASTVVVDADSVRGLPAVFGCVRNVAGTIAALPCAAVRRVQDERGRWITSPVERDHWLARLLRRPNRWQTWGMMIEDLTWHRMLHGNAWLMVQRDRMQQPDQLLPLHPDRIRVEYEAAGMTIYHDDKRVNWDDLVHLRGDGAGDGPIGRSILEMETGVFALALTAQRHLRASLDEPVPRLALTTERSLAKDLDGKKRIEEAWDRFTGPGGRKRVALLDQGLKPEILSRSNSELQLTELRDAVNLDIARIFRVPPHKIGMDFSGALRNLEEQNRSWAMDRIVPDVTALQDAFEFHLIPSVEAEEGLCLRWDVGRLVVGDLRTQLERVRVLILSGVLSPDDVRAEEDLPPLPKGRGDVYVLPMNTGPIEKVAPAGGGPDPEPGADPKEGEE